MTSRLHLKKHKQLHFFRSFSSFLCLLISLSLSSGCKELENLNLEDLENLDNLEDLLENTCDEDAQRLATVLETEGRLSDEVAEEPPYPMSIIVSQDALNRLFAEVASHEIDPIEIPVGELLGFELKIIVSPDLPLIQIEAVEGCDTCIITEASFGVAFDIEGFRAGARGFARYQFPVRMVPQGLELTRVYGDFHRSAFQTLNLEVTEDFDIDIPFVDIGVNDAIDLAEPYIKEYVTELVQQEYGEVELFDLEPWAIGNGEIKLLGRGPILYPESKTLIIGIHTNLVQPLSSSVELEPSLPEGADLGLQLHPELIQVMIQRMMHEGHVSRTYNQSGSTMIASEPMMDNELEVDRGFDVTLSTLKQAEDEAGLLTAGFTMWQTAGEALCGSAELQADLGVSIGDGGIALTAQNMRVENGQGAFGFLAETADNWLNSDFMKDVIDVSEFTLNYDELNLPNNKKAKMTAETFRLEIGGNGFNIFLNLNAVVDRTPENESALFTSNQMMDSMMDEGE